VALQRWSEDTTDLTSGHVRLGPRSQLNSLVIPMGGWLAKHDLRVDLAGEGADAELLGLYCAHADQNIDFHTRQMHMVPQTRSDLLYKGVLLGRSRVLYRGLIRAEPGAMKTDAYQANRNLVLSDTAKAEPMPMLEILANDLRCTHGATVGQVDRDMLFYLQSRGLPEAQAKLLVVNGFFEEMLQRVPLKHVREDLVKVIAAKVTR
jgi:Fe-S cluster assembly protein SufD